MTSEPIDKQSEEAGAAASQAPAGRFETFVAFLAGAVFSTVIASTPLLMVTADFKPMIAFSEIRGLDAALAEYETANGAAFAVGGDLRTLAPAFIEHLRPDPWGNDYTVVAPTELVDRPHVMSLGADGKPGGEGFAADVSLSTPPSLRNLLIEAEIEPVIYGWIIALALGVTATSFRRWGGAYCLGSVVAIARFIYYAWPRLLEVVAFG